MNKSANKSVWDSFDNAVIAPTKRLHTYAIASYIAKAASNSLGYKRDFLPQINDVEQTLDHVVNRWGAKTRKMKIKSLKPSQNEFNTEKVRGMVYDDTFNPYDRTYFVDENGYLLDGHHSWIYGNIVNPEKRVRVVWIPLPFKKVKTILNRLKNTDNKTVKECLGDYRAIRENQITFMGYKNNVPTNEENALFSTLDVLDGYYTFTEGSKREFQKKMNGELRNKGLKSVVEIEDGKLDQFLYYVGEMCSKGVDESIQESDNRNLKFGNPDYVKRILDKLFLDSPIDSTEYKNGLISIYPKNLSGFEVEELTKISHFLGLMGFKVEVPKDDFEIEFMAPRSLRESKKIPNAKEAIEKMYKEIYGDKYDQGKVDDMINGLKKDNPDVDEATLIAIAKKSLNKKPVSEKNDTEIVEGTDKEYKDFLDKKLVSFGKKHNNGEAYKGIQEIPKDLIPVFFNEVEDEYTIEEPENQ